MRKNVIGPFNSINETGLDANTNGEKISVEQLDKILLDVIWSNGNTPVAIITVEYSNDNETWREINFGSAISISGASGSHQIDIEPNFKWIRPVVTFSSGDCDLLIEAHGTTLGA